MIGDIACLTSVDIEVQSIPTRVHYYPQLELPFSRLVVHILYQVSAALTPYHLLIYGKVVNSMHLFFICCSNGSNLRILLAGISFSSVRSHKCSN